MHLTLCLDQIPAGGIRPDETVVTTAFRHPVRGHVQCPAAALIAADAQWAGLGVSIRPQPDASPDGTAVLYTASYIDRDGRCLGIGVMVPADDPLRAERAAAAIRRWASAMRTRLLILAPLGQRCTPHSCPAVARAQRAHHDFLARGDHVVVIGRREDPATEAVLAVAPGTELLETPEDVRRLSPSDGVVSFVPAPGITTELVTAIAAQLRARFSHAPGQHPDDWCHAASDRQWTLRAATAGADAILVFGAEPDLDLAEAAIARDARGDGPIPVTSLSELARLPLDRWATIAAVTTDPHGRHLVQQTGDVLSGLGPLSVVTRTTETAHPSRYDAPPGPMSLRQLDGTVPELPGRHVAPVWQHPGVHGPDGGVDAG